MRVVGFRAVVALMVVLQAGLLAKAAPEPLRNAVECTVRGGLPNFAAKLQAGKTVTIAYFGGSITAQGGYRLKSRHYFQEQFPQATVKEIHAAIGGTGSDLGVFRLQHDVLSHKPDLVFVEFAVNDHHKAPVQIHQTFEGIVRQIWQADPETDILFVYTLAERDLRTLLDGKFQRSASAMEEVADFYKIPSIHMGLEVARLTAQGTVVFKAKKGSMKQVAGQDLEKDSSDAGNLGNKIVFSGDGVHPYTDSGHQLYQEAIARSWPKIERAGKAGPHPLGKPMREDNWEKAKTLPLSAATLSGNWQKMDMTAGIGQRFRSRFGQLYKAATPGESLTFKFKGTQVAFYDLLGPDCGQLTVSLDGKERVVPRMDKYCSYHRIARLTVGAELTDTVHTVTVKVHPEPLKKETILFKHKLPELQSDPQKYEGINWYVGGIQIIGEPVAE